MAGESGSSPLQTFLAVLAALVVFGVVVLVFQARQDSLRGDRCGVQAYVDAIDRDAGGSGVPLDDDC